MDGYIIVKYRADLPAAQLRQLSAFAGQKPGVIVVSGGTQMPFPVGAVSRQLSLSCQSVAVDELAAFRDRWQRSLR